MKHQFNQFYYTAAPDLFNKSRNSGWGIFGSSMPDRPEENEKIEQISKDWVPMRLEEEKAFPVEYVMYYDDRYIVGGAASCNTLIEGDNRPNIWTHVLVPKQEGEKSFLACLAVSSFDKVQKKKEKIYLKDLEIEAMEQKVSGSMLKTWKDPETDAMLLKLLLAGLSGTNCRMLITDEDLSDEDFKAYQELARNMMYHIYQLLPGCLRKELNFITPMVSKYFRFSSEKPRGARFYFGPEDQNEPFDQVISMQQGRRLMEQNFYDQILIQMCRIFHEQNDLYEEIGQKFQKSHYGMNEKDYLWHFIFEMIERGLSIDWTRFGIEEYQEAYDQAWTDEERKKRFLKLTAVLLDAKEGFRVSSEYFAIYCRMIRAFEKENDPDGWNDMMYQCVRWMASVDRKEGDLLEQFLDTLAISGIDKDIRLKIQSAVMQNSPNLERKAKKVLIELSEMSELENWWAFYAPLKDKFEGILDQKIEYFFREGKDLKSKKAALRLDAEILDGKIKGRMIGQITEELRRLSLDYLRTWEIWRARGQDLKILDQDRFEEILRYWQNEFCKAAEDKHIFLDPTQKEDLRRVADDLELDWNEICSIFSVSFSEDCYGWGRQEIDEYRELAEELEPSIAKIVREICDDAQARIEREEKSLEKEWMRTATNDELLDAIFRTTSQRQIRMIWDTISSRILRAESITDGIELQLFSLYYMNHPNVSKERKDKFWQMCTPRWFRDLEKILCDPNARILEDILDYEDMPFEGKLFFLYHSGRYEDLERAKRQIRRRLKNFSGREKEAARKYFEEEDVSISRVLHQELSQSNRKQSIGNIRTIMKSAFWIALNLFVYECIIKLNDIHPVSAVVCWMVILILCMISFLVLMKKQKAMAGDRLLLFGALLWSSCGAIIKAMFGIIGLTIYVTALFVISLIVLLAGNRQGK